jgi:hypothetical protein
MLLTLTSIFLFAESMIILTILLEASESERKHGRSGQISLANFPVEGIVWGNVIFLPMIIILHLVIYELPRDKKQSNESREDVPESHWKKGAVSETNWGMRIGT